MGINVKKRKICEIREICVPLLIISHRKHGTHRYFSFEATLSVSSVSVLFYYLTRTESTESTEISI